MSISPDALARFNTAFDGSGDDLGERVVRAFLEAWEGAPEESEPLMAMLRAGMVNEQAEHTIAGFHSGPADRRCWRKPERPTGRGAARRAGVIDARRNRRRTTTGRSSYLGRS